MTTTLQNFKAAIESTWTALVPAVDGSGQAYRFIDSLNEERGGGQHRELFWLLAERATLVSEIEEQLEWPISCELYLHRRPNQTLRAFYAQCEDEATDLKLAFSGMTAFGTGVRAPILDRFRFVRAPAEARPPRSGGIERPVVQVVTFDFRVTCQEEA